MATRTYFGTPPINPDQMAAFIDAATGRTGTRVSLLTLSGTTTISVTHASLVAGDDATIAGVIAAYVFNADFLTSGQTAQGRADALTNLASHEGRGLALRAAALVLIDEVNVLREWLVQFKAEVAAATTLADLKTRVGTLPALPDRTPAQAVTAIRNKINSGAVDTAP